MREIKFRGLTSHSKEWRYGNLAKIDNSYHIFEQCDLTEDGHHIRQDSDRPTWIKEETIGQFTGWYDKNGKEIYEGDIVSIHEIPFELNHIGKVIFNEQNASFKVHIEENGRTYRMSFISSDTYNDGYCSVDIKYDFEVIGNIYDNPELI